MRDGFELRESSGKGEGIFATKSFKFGDIVMVGVIKEALNGNHSHASQIGENEYVLHAGLISKVNHCCSPNCGIIPVAISHDTIAHSRFVMEAILPGSAMKSSQASQQASTMSL